MFKPQSLDELRLTLLSWLAENEPRLTDASQGSVLMSLLRCFAAAQQENEHRLAQAVGAAFIETAYDRHLDEWAAPFGLQRRPPKVARGWALFKFKDSAALLEGIDYSDRFVEPKSQISFALDADWSNSYQQVGPLELAYPIVALEAGAAGNLAAGTLLLAVRPLDAEIIVGQHRTTAGLPCGNLSGGRDIETDAELRRRLMDLILVKVPSRSALKSLLLGHDWINDVRCSERLRGVIELWLDTEGPLSDEQKQSLEAQLEPYRPLGSVWSINRIQYYDVAIEIEVIHDPTDRDDLGQLLYTQTRQLLQQMDIGETLYPKTIERSLLAVPTVRFVKVLAPTEPVNAPVNFYFRLSRLQSTFQLP